MKQIIKSLFRIKPKNIKFFFSLTIFLFISTPSYSYFDPGTGAFIIQAILAVGATIVFYLGYPIKLFKSFLKRFSGDKKKTSQQLEDEKVNKS